MKVECRRKDLWKLSKKKAEKGLSHCTQREYSMKLNTEERIQKNGLASEERTVGSGTHLYAICTTSVVVQLRIEIV